MRLERRLALVKQHKQWCDRYVVFSLAVILAIFVGMTLVMDQLKASEADRPELYIILATMILATIIWNAAAKAVVEIHKVIESEKLQ